MVKVNNQSMKYLFLFVVAIGITVFGYMKYDTISQPLSSMILAIGLVLALYSGVQLLRL
jgi:hypothetical protein